MRAIAQFPEVQFLLADAHGAGLVDLLLEDLLRWQRAPAAPAVAEEDAFAEDGQDARGAVDIVPEDDSDGNPCESGEESAGWRCVSVETVPSGFRARCAELWDLLAPRAPEPARAVTARRSVSIWDGGIEIDGYSDWRVVHAFGPHWALVFEVQLPDNSDYDTDACDIRVLLVEERTYQEGALPRVATARILAPLVPPRFAA